MAKNKQLTPEEIKVQINGIDLEGKIAVIHHTQKLVDELQQHIANQLQQIEDSKKK
jgi:hypothetical protein